MSRFEKLKLKTHNEGCRFLLLLVSLSLLLGSFLPVKCKTSTPLPMMAKTSVEWSIQNSTSPFKFPHTSEGSLNFELRIKTGKKIQVFTYSLLLLREVKFRFFFSSLKSFNDACVCACKCCLPILFDFNELFSFGLSISPWLPLIVIFSCFPWKFFFFYCQAAQQTAHKPLKIVCRLNYCRSPLKKWNQSWKKGTKERERDFLQFADDTSLDSYN